MMLCTVHTGMQKSIGFILVVLFAGFASVCNIQLTGQRTLSSFMCNDPSLIPIQSGVADEDLKEWALIEVNGELLPPKDQKAIESLDYIELGSLTYDVADKKSPRLIIGSHELQGKLQELKQSYCILQKEDGEYKVRGIVKQKLLFNQYPKTIMR